MSLRDRIPDQLRIKDALIAITLETDVEVFPTSEYILLEISHKAGRVNIPRITSEIYGLVKNERKMVAIRGFGFKGTGLAVRVAHELKKREKRFIYEMTFDTFEASDSQDSRPFTSIQIVVMPPE
ncbi:hypothetical protein EU524_01320 [Candidatus Thorarchaeota archaeon]|jgi:hypothetical protein|nr:MAG: hypothetical protein EU524_01320 [Candidatus Thorarchaeota archaeon]